MRKWLLVHAWLITGVVSASPCTGIDRTLTDAQKHAWAPVIAKQLHVANVDVLQVFREGDWRVIYVDTHVSDNRLPVLSQRSATRHLRQYVGRRGDERRRGVHRPVGAAQRAWHSNAAGDMFRLACHAGPRHVSDPVLRCGYFSTKARSMT
jgi:hypothetical protein